MVLMQDYITWSWRNAVNHSRGWELKQTFAASNIEKVIRPSCFPPRIGFSSMDESVRIHMESLTWYQQDMKVKIAGGSCRSARSASASPVCHPTFSCPPRMMGTLQSPLMCWCGVVVETAPHSRLLLTACWQWLLPVCLTCFLAGCGLVSHIPAPTLPALHTVCCSSISNRRQEQGRGQRTFQSILERNAYLS